MITPEMMAKSGSEDAEQSALFCWSALPSTRVEFPQLQWMFAIPNGGFRDIRTAGKLKATGVKAGVWDIFLPIPIGSYAGYFIEMKVNKNGLSPLQKSFGVEMSQQRYQTGVFYKWEDAALSLKNYLRGLHG